MGTRTLRRAIAGIVLVLFVGFAIWYECSQAIAQISERLGRPATAGSAQLSDCGRKTLDAIELGRANMLIDRKVATFFPWGCPSKSSSCKFSGITRAYPDAACSPGAIYDLTGNTDPAKYDEAANMRLICASKTDGRRNVPDAFKRQVFSTYGVVRHTGSSHEIDHIVSLTLGGSNTTANLYPEAAAPLPGYHQKDLVEVQLGRRICQGTISLSSAQEIIAHSWLDYLKQLPSA